MRKDNILFIIALVMIVFMAGYCSREREPAEAPGASPPDTVFVEQTKSFSSLELKPARKYTLENHFRGLTKMVLIDVRQLDTVFIHDSVFIGMPRQYREYREDDFFAVVSGIDPTLDSLAIHSRNSIVNHRPALKRNILSIYAQPTWTGSFHFPVGLSYDYRLRRWLSVGGSVGYDLPSSRHFITANTKIIFEW